MPARDVANLVVAISGGAVSTITRRLAAIGEGHKAAGHPTRATETVGLDVADVEEVDEGLLVRLERSKTD